MARRTALPLLALLILLISALPAHAAQVVRPPAPEGAPQAASPAGPLLAPGARASASRDLWATVNVCDTLASPDAMGLRASMPGNGRRQRMYMRFSAQWYSGTPAKWLAVAGERSPWIYAGSARSKARQAGWTFDFVTPSLGQAYVLRGAVQYQWRALRRKKGAHRARYKVVRERTALTSSGVRGVRGGDPTGTSKAMCAVAGLGPG